MWGQNFEGPFLAFHFFQNTTTLTRYSEETMGDIMFKSKDLGLENTCPQNGPFDCELNYIFILKSNSEGKIILKKQGSTQKC